MTWALALLAVPACIPLALVVFNALRLLGYRD